MENLKGMKAIRKDDEGQVGDDSVSIPNKDEWRNQIVLPSPHI